ncbi:MAG: hypothetical protein ABIK28_10395 [Planctomycetota bacterium]
MLYRLSPFGRKLISLAVAVGSLTTVFLFVLHPAMVQGSSQLMIHTLPDETSGNEGGGEPLSLGTADEAREDSDSTHDGGESHRECRNNDVNPEADQAEEKGQAFTPVQAGRGTAGRGGAEALDETIASVHGLQEEGVADHQLKCVLLDLHTGEALCGSQCFVEVFSGDEPPNAVPVERVVVTGEFELSGLREGAYTIGIRSEGYAPFRTCVEVPADGEVCCRLEALGAVRIRVTDQYARRLKSVEIRLAEDGEMGTGVFLKCQQENGYHVVEGLREGIRTLQIEAPGFEPYHLEVLVDLHAQRTYWAVLE